MRVLYITHHGILEPLGQTQILPYLSGLALRGHSIDVLSFEKKAHLNDCARVAAQLRGLQAAGIRWFPRPYRHGRSLRHLFADILVTSREIQRRCMQDGIDLLHCRSHVSASMAWPAATRCKKPLLFDFRGFLAEEFVDAGLWRQGGFRFRLTKAFERRAAKACSALVALTEPARAYLKEMYQLDLNKLFVIPCCVDLERFRPNERPVARDQQRPVSVVYAGSTSGRYRTAEMLRFFTLLLDRRPGSHFNILSNGEDGSVRALVGDSGLRPDSVSVDSLPSDKVPNVLSQQDLGLIFIRGGRALSAASPTKLGEYLASGLTVVAEERLGGLQKLLIDEGVGCLIDSGRPETWPAVLDKALQICGQSGATASS